MKNKLRTSLCIILAVIILITLTGCGDKEENDKKKGSNESQQTEINDDNKSKIDLGKWENNVYTNDYLGFKFTLPTDWEAATDKEIAEMMQLGEDTLANEGKYLSEVAKLSIIYYASATDTNTGSNIIIMSEKTTVSLDSYVSTLKSQLESLSQMSYKVTSEGTAKIASKDFKTITLSESTYGLNQKYYICEYDGAFLGIIMTSIDGEDTFNELERAFE